MEAEDPEVARLQAWAAREGSVAWRVRLQRPEEAAERLVAQEAAERLRPWGRRAEEAAEDRPDASPDSDLCPEDREASPSSLADQEARAAAREVRRDTRAAA